MWSKDWKHTSVSQSTQSKREKDAKGARCAYRIFVLHDRHDWYLVSLHYLLRLSPFLSLQRWGRNHEDFEVCQSINAEYRVSQLYLKTFQLFDQVWEEKHCIVVSICFLVSCQHQASKRSTGLVLSCEARRLMLGGSLPGATCVSPSFGRNFIFLPRQLLRAAACWCVAEPIFSLASLFIKRTWSTMPISLLWSREKSLLYRATISTNTPEFVLRAPMTSVISCGGCEPRGAGKKWPSCPTSSTSKSGKRTRMMVASQGEVTFQSVDRRTHEC